MPGIDRRTIAKRYSHAQPALRKRCVELREQNWEWQEISDALGYCPRSCQTWYLHHCNTGVHCSSRRHQKGWSKLSLLAQNEMELALSQRPHTFYDELQTLVWERTGESVSISTIGRMCRSAGYTNKRASNISTHRNKHAMREHALLRQRFHYTQFICIDEAHKGGKNLGRRYAKVRRGERAYVPLSSHIGRSWTVLAAMNFKGYVDGDVQELASTPDSYLPKALNREMWLEMFRVKILPYLNPADERQLHNSVVIIDNASLHWGNDSEDEVLAMVNTLYDWVTAAGAVLIYTPPYCPRANPIEAMFNLMNKFLEREVDGITRTDPESAIEEGLMSVSAETAEALIVRSVKDVQSWLRPGAGLDDGENDEEQ
jgi:transposase|eukprot:COSAG01_NODE_2876_length_6927_cov_482.724810_2_plen_372_part_00